jgi:hypothetical protein
MMMILNANLNAVADADMDAASFSMFFFFLFSINIFFLILSLFYLFHIVSIQHNCLMVPFAGWCECKSLYNVLLGYTIVDRDG